MEQARRYEKSGTHWVESIGIPGIPECHFEIGHRMNRGVHFIDKILFVGPRGVSDVAKEIGTKRPRIFIDENNLGEYLPLTKECCVRGVKNITELLIALHEVGHQAQEEPYAKPVSKAPIPDISFSLLNVKKVLAARGILVHQTDELLQKFDSELVKLQHACSEREKEEISRRLEDMGGKDLFEAFGKIRSVMLEQDATGRVLTALKRIEKKHRVNFLNVTLEPQKELMFEDADHFTMYPWFNPKSMTASLDIGLASHHADVPLIMVCEKYLSGKYDVVVSESLKGIQVPRTLTPYSGSEK